MTLEEAKAWCKITHDSEDDLINDLIVMAVDRIQQVTGRQLFTATWDLFDNETSDCIPIPLPPVSAISAFSFFEKDGTENSIDSANWSADLNSFPAKLNIVEHDVISSAISAADELFDYWKVRFTSGYGLLQTDLPEWTQMFGRQLVAQFYAMRMADDPKESNKAEGVIKSLERQMLAYRVEIL
jgi:uncharacterized phiE125 gp8 family phage protein